MRSSSPPMPDRSAPGPTSSDAGPAVPILPGLSAFIGPYQGLILDLWGVVHDGHEPYPGALDALVRLRAEGKLVCLLSNAPRRCAPVAARLAELGISPAHYDHLLTSGELTFEALRNPPDAWHAALGRRFLHIGPARDRTVFAGVARTAVAAPADADFMLNTGIANYGETLADYEGLLVACAERGLPMVCANPDLVVLIGTTMEICAGTLALRYEELGGQVRYHGKPHPPAYRSCLERIGITDRNRVVAIGDSLRTDVAGAEAAGIDAVLVTGGIHAEELGGAGGDRPDPAKLAAVLAASGHRPVAAIARLRW
jgi:HAD superfamily hydrolase (TIGR01459 family)